MSVTKYNSKDWSVIVGGSVSITGLGEDMVSGEKEEEFFTESVGGLGDVIVSETNNPLGNVTLTIQKTCPQRAYLKAWAKSGDIRSIWCENKSLGVRFGGSMARPKNFPEAGGGKEADDIEFEIRVFDYTDDEI